jgi:ABC-type transport system substrate-binding protein
VYAAFAIALIVGATVFAIWWLTAPGRGAGAGDSASGQPQPAQQPPTPEARIEVSLPRGGSVTGSVDDVALAVERLTGAPLVRVSRATDAVEPWVAESWEASPDNLIYKVKLRGGLMTADGAPFAAEAVAVALGSVHAFGQPVSVRALDAATLEVRFPQPFAPGLRAFAAHPIPGLGPFIEQKKAGAGREKTRVFVRNPHYWRKAGDGSPLPYLDEITLAPGGPGQHDFADMAVRADDMEELRKLEQAGKLRLFDLGPGLDAGALWFRPAEDEARPWLTDVKFRQAVSAAVDRREYCKQVYFGACDPIAGPVTPANLNWFNPDLPIGRGDTDLARAMLTELGFRDRDSDGVLDDAALRPVKFSLAIRSDAPAAARAAKFLADTLLAVGVRVDVTPLSASALAARRQKGNYDAIYDRIEMRDTDPAMNLDFWLSSGAAHPWNPARTRPPADWERQIDQLMQKHAASFDRIERLQTFVDVQKLYAQYLPTISFGAPYTRIVTSMRALNATPVIVRPHLLWNADSLAALK